MKAGRDFTDAGAVFFLASRYFKAESEMRLNGITIKQIWFLKWWLAGVDNKNGTFQSEMLLPNCKIELIQNCSNYLPRKLLELFFPAKNWLASTKKCMTFLYGALSWYFKCVTFYLQCWRWNGLQNMRELKFS